MRAVDLIVKKRQGEELTRDEIRFLIQGYVQGSIPDYQISAWAMAVFFRGMSFEETGFLTRAMIDSGEVFDLSGVDGFLVDKHSTGGVGDKISLILAPLAAACGVKVPMMSGRALGHTGGTLDKLDAITGYSTALDADQIVRGLQTTGFIMTGQSARVVPADRLLYALRDVTGTVESVPLITASILSKKFAEGAQALIFDVKCGGGAFMKDLESARALAVSLVETGRSLGRQVVATITDMNEPLGRMTGNFLEVEESVRVLEGTGPADLVALTLRQTAWMLVAAGLVATVEAGEELARARLADGSALAKFYENVAFQGGDVAKLKKDLGKRRAYFSQDVTAPAAGFVTAIDAYGAGILACSLGAGRNTKDDVVLANVGLEFFKKVGEKVAAGEVLVRVYGEDSEKLGQALKQAQKLFTIGADAPPPRKLILEEITAL